MATNTNPSVIIGGGGTASVGSPISITGAGSGYPWTTASSTMTAKGQLKVEGEDADIFVQGKSMKAWMEKVEQRLSILEPKPELLAKYESLQQAYDHYKTLESLLYDDQKPNK